MIGAIAAGIACSSSSDDAEPVAEGGTEGGPLHDAPGLDEFPAPDPDTGAQDPSLDEFEDPGGCGGWQADGVTLTWRQPGAHGSKGTCEICVTDAGGVAFKLVPLNPGTYSLEAQVLRLDGGTGDASWTESLSFSHGDGTDPGYKASFGPIPSAAYGAAEMTATTKDGVRVLMRIGKTGGNDDCFLVDDIRLAAR
jgi:hypothetical protein